MSFPRRQAAIVGVYRTKQEKRITDRSSFELQVEAITGALDDAGLTLADVDGLLPMSGGNNHIAAMDTLNTAYYQYWAEQLGGRPITYIEVGGSAGMIAKAAMAIDAGMCEVAVLFHGKAGWNIGPKSMPKTDVAPRVAEWQFSIQGIVGMAPFYAMWAQRYMHEFGVTAEDLARAAVIDRYHATLNPDSIMGEKGEITVDDVVNSRMIADPLHLLDCSIDNDGGYAIVITSAERARDLKKKPIYILGGGEAVHTDFYLSQDGDWFPESGKSVRRATDIAFATAGVTRDDIDVFGSYDCFTVTYLRNLEEMGFCGLGEGKDFVKDGHTRLGGKLPTNPHGGLLSDSHCGTTDGLFPVEVVTQLRGEAGARQVEGAKIGLAHQQGFSVHGLTSAVILAAD